MIYEEHLPKRQYVLCPNHTSALDIASIPLINETFTFVGKNDIAKIPLFGYMFKKLHISVDRGSLRSQYQTIESSKAAIQKGKSILIFPEGGIHNPNPPELSKFKDGPFRIAIETGAPIVPITIPFNWIILPDEKILLFKRKGAEIRIIVHKPIPTKGLSLENLEDLKMRTFDCIESELEKQANEYR